MSTTRRKVRTQKRTAPSPAPQSQIDHLVVMRESSMYDQVLMDGMIGQTLAKVAHLPGAQELAEIGVEIFQLPERYGGVSRRSGDSRMVIVERDGVLYLYSMGTAAKHDLTDANAFIRELVEIVATYRPQEVWVVAFTRLLRSAVLAGELLNSFTQNILKLHCEAEIDLSTPEGKMLFQMLAMIAAMERDYIVRRHTAGRVAQARRGEWIPNGFPPGYRKVDGHLILDEGSVDQVRKMLSILADHSLATSDCAQRIGALGITTPMVSRLHGPDATIADARNPAEIINTLVGWVDSYESGRYEMLWPSPFPGVTDIAGLSIEAEEGFDHGVLRLAHQLPLPEGDWADEATFKAIRSRVKQRTLLGGASHKKAPPLVGMFRFTDNGYEHALLCEIGTYKLVRRPCDPERQFLGWTSEADKDIGRSDVEHLASVSRVQLHRSIADAVTEAVRTGLPAELDSTRFQAVGGLPPLNQNNARVRHLRRELDNNERALKRALRNISLTEDDEVAAELMPEIEKCTRDKRRLEKELERLSDTETPALGETFETNAELVARAMAALHNADNSTDSALSAALRTVISREHFRVKNNTVHWEISIELPHEEGTIFLGPITGQLRDIGRRRPLPGIGSKARKEARRALIQAGLGEIAARSAAACPHPELQTVLLAHLNGEPLPDDTDIAWATHVIDVYTSPDFAWNPDRWRLDDAVRREALALIESAGGRLDNETLNASGLDGEQLRYLSRNINTPSGDPIIIKTGRGAGRVFELIPCPHCGHHATYSVVTPETKPGVLCNNCWRTPTANSPVFPEWYRTTNQ